MRRLNKSDRHSRRELTFGGSVTNIHLGAVLSIRWAVSGIPMVGKILCLITRNYCGHLAQRIAPFFLPRLRYWRIPLRRERDRKLSYILNVT